MDKERLEYKENLRKQRGIFNRNLSDDLPESYKCSLCEQDAELVRINDKVAVYYHDCTALLGIDEITNTVMLWVKRPYGKFSVEHGVLLVDIDE